MLAVLRRFAGAAAILVALVGVGLSVYAIVQASSVAERVRSEVPDAIDQLAEIVRVLETQGESVASSLTLAREHTRSVAETIEELAGRDQPGGNVRRLASNLEAELRQRLTNTEEFVKSMQGTMRSMSGTLLVLDGMPFVAPRFSGDETAPSQLRTMAANLSRTADELDRVAADLSEMRSGRPVDSRQVAFLKQSLQSVDDQLAATEREVRSFGERLSRARETMASWRTGIEPAVNRFQIATITFFVCFACTQLALAALGWNCLRSKPGAVTVDQNRTLTVESVAGD